ncbi:hypothetical protein [Spirilliplanes yamanashiensis]|uniref:Uncharacterized protein n=1 Tax=Spirilliplanes yamanashiensis TaxID=42233 RepID=A0A8J4DH22_9ACTN|nr:hypothetical protein [Spirilliplanes yamanashiensis]MDP9814208.1 hypothetical protein [Spirilliplanes yamanashiensis]GIJ00810.1 hypothetical protein Sya03_01620 [Spirilliplanes yamanashiensis]
MTVAGVGAPDVGRVVCRDGADRLLLDVAARAVRKLPCADLDRPPLLGRHPGLPRDARRRALAQDAYADAVPVDTARRIDPEAVAAWFAGHYAGDGFPALVLGSPHGAAVHLAAAMGAPWLPTSFTVTVRRGQAPSGEPGAIGDAVDVGAEVAAGLLAAHPGVTVRQVHDPVRRGPGADTTVTLHVRWLALPEAYGRLLTERLRPGAPVLLFRDTRTWPVLRVGPGHTCQIGSPVGGLHPHDHLGPGHRELTLRAQGRQWSLASYPALPGQYAETAGEPELERDLRRTAAGAGTVAHRVLYPRSEALSAAAADVHRDQAAALGGGDRLVVESDRLLDPWLVQAGGLVPYWCETSSARTVDAAELWLAGSRPFAEVLVLPAPPGTVRHTHASLGQWRALASFAGRHGEVDLDAMRHYPHLALPTAHASRALRTPGPAAPAPALPPADVLAGLRRHGRALGLLVL